MRYLAEMLGGGSRASTRLIVMLVLSHGDAHIAVGVDEILQEEDAVVRPLPWNLAGVRGLSGAVGLADGTVAVVPDIARMFSLKAARHGREREDAGPRKMGRTRILVADDSMTTRSMHRNLLMDAGYDVVAVPDGAEAWRALQRESFDAVVSDVEMPELDGFELTRRIRRDSRLDALPVVLVTSLARPEDAQRGVEAGADEYVVKGPLEQDALLAAIARHCV